MTELLVKENVITYCPLNRVMRQWSDRKKLVYEPLFTCYVFVQLSSDEVNRVRGVYGVINFVCWLGKPAIIKDEEIEIIKRFLNEYENVHLEKADISINDVVRIKNGPLMQSEGRIMSVYGRKVKVYLPTLGYAMVAEIEKTNLEVVKKANRL